MTVKLRKVKDDESFARDTKTGAILNVDNAGLMAYKNRRQMSTQVDEINKLKEDMQEIKSLLTKIVKDK
tara:strand:- start:369 stop:575 length:207 start_codon:yes stop_codon:yes gene_type:complete